MKLKIKKIFALTILASVVVSCSDEGALEKDQHSSYVNEEKMELGKIIANSLLHSDGSNLLTNRRFDGQNEVLLTDLFESLQLKDGDKLLTSSMKKEGIWECFVYQQEKINNKTLKDIKILFVPENDNAKILEGVDIYGNEVQITTAQPSESPILFIDAHGKYSFQKNMELLNKEIEKNTPLMQSQLKQNANMATPVDFSKIDSIRLSDVQEPWFKGNPEIYAIVFNFDKNDNDPNVPPMRVLQMPYIKKKNVTYTPEQPFVFWNEHTRNAATMIIMEEDSGFDYSGIVKIVVQAIGTGVSLGTGDTVWTPFVVNTVTTIIDAIQGDWWKDSDDEIDQYYIIRKQDVTQPKSGASQNASITYSFETL